MTSWVSPGDVTPSEARWPPDGRGAQGGRPGGSGWCPGAGRREVPVPGVSEAGTRCLASCLGLRTSRCCPKHSRRGGAGHPCSPRLCGEAEGSVTGAAQDPPSRRPRPEFRELTASTEARLSRCASTPTFARSDQTGNRLSKVTWPWRISSHPSICCEPCGPWASQHHPHTRPVSPASGGESRLHTRLADWGSPCPLPWWTWPPQGGFKLNCCRCGRVAGLSTVFN